MIVLKIIGWILLALLALIIFLLCIKVHINVEYSNENTSAYIKWLFLKIPLYPAKKKEKAADEKAAQTAPEQAAPLADEMSDTAESQQTADGAQPATATAQPATATAAKPAKESLLHLIYRSNGIDGLIVILKRLFSYLGTFTGNALNGVVFEELYIDVSCTKGDAAATAIYYGEVCATVFPILGALVSKYKVKKYDFNIYPDYIARFSNASFVANIYIIPIYFIGIVLALVFKLLFGVLGRMAVKIFLTMKNDSAGKSNKENNTTEKSEVPNE